ncbi:MAG: hypothetical protein AABW92_02725 [Nanoarchaeota archaeon]
MREIYKLLKDRQIEVSEIYLGVCNGKSYPKLNSDIEITVASGTFNFKEWIELRDLVGIDGRIVDCETDGQRRFIPYWENLGQWASIPEKSINPVREICLSYNERIMSMLENDGLDIGRIGKKVSYGGK